MSPEVIEAAKAVVLDGPGVMLARSREEPARIVADYVREMGQPSPEPGRTPVRRWSTRG